MPAPVSTTGANAVNTVPVTPTKVYPNIPTMPPPTVVTSQPAEDAINVANNNVATFNANAIGGASAPTGNAPLSTGAPGGSAPQTFYSYTDPSTKQTSYYSQDDKGNFTEVDPGAVKGQNVQNILTAGGAATAVTGQSGFTIPTIPGASIDINGNIAGTSVPAAVALGTPADVESLNSQILQANTQISQAGQNALNIVQGFMNGTINLTPAQTSLITAMTSQMQNLIALQQQAGMSQIGVATEAAARGEQYDPVNAAAMVHQAVFQANLQLSALQADQAEAIAKVQDSFQSEDYSAMLDANDKYEQSIKDQQSVLENLQGTIQSSIESARTFNAQQTQNMVQNIFNNAQLSFQERNAMAQNLLSQSTLTEKTKNDIIQNQIQAEIAANGRYEVTSVLGMPMVFDKSVGRVVGNALGSAVNGTYSGANPSGQQVTPGNTGIPILDQNTKISATGVPYIDGTNLSGDTGTQAQYIAATYGIPFMTSERATALGKITEANSNIQSVQDYIKQLNPTSGFSRPFVDLLHFGEGVTQIGPAAGKMNSYQGFVNSAVSAIQAIAAGGTGLRVTQTEINNMMNTIPSPYDTQDVANSKISLFKALIDNNERSIVGAKVYDNYNPNQATSDLASIYQSAANNPVPGTSQTYKATIDTLRSQGYSPSQILQVVLP